MRQRTTFTCSKVQYGIKLFRDEFHRARTRSKNMLCNMQGIMVCVYSERSRCWLWGEEVQTGEMSRSLCEHYESIKEVFNAWENVLPRAPNTNGDSIAFRIPSFCDDGSETRAQQKTNTANANNCIRCIKSVMCSLRSEVCSNPGWMTSFRNFCSNTRAQEIEQKSNGTFDSHSESEYRQFACHLLLCSVSKV